MAKMYRVKIQFKDMEPNWVLFHEKKDADSYIKEFTELGYKVEHAGEGETTE